MVKVKYGRADEDTLREFAAEIKRLTNFPLDDEIVEEAIKAMKPKPIKEEQEL